ncbi:MAG: FtsQ-type POTRA domain-containing protein [Thermodesulfobacteriota bacterium]|nr:FtsQ-type POTRA domain-containing protein [Thermodesulfobacteriota bacterium]
MRSEKADAASSFSLFSFDFMQSIDLGIKFILTIVVVSLVTLLFIFVHDMATQAPYFKVKKISIKGVDHLDRADILKQAKVSLKDNILLLNLFKIKKRLQAHGWIKDASVARIIPDELIIRVEEEKPLAVARLGLFEINIADILMNTNGIPFKEYDAEKDKQVRSLPVITGLTLAEKDGVYFFEEKLLNLVLNILSLAQKEKIEHIKVDADTGVKIEMTWPDNRFDDINEESLKLKLGFNRYESKLKKVEQVFDYVHRNIFDRKVCSMDLFDLERVTVKLGKRSQGTAPAALADT